MPYAISRRLAKCGRCLLYAFQAILPTWALFAIRENNLVRSRQTLFAAHTLRSLPTWTTDIRTKTSRKANTCSASVWRDTTGHNPMIAKTETQENSTRRQSVRTDPVCTIIQLLRSAATTDGFRLFVRVSMRFPGCPALLILLVPLYCAVNASRIV